jgi:hypothetical protein
MKYIYKFLFLVLITAVLYLFFKGFQYNKEIEENKRITVCKYVYCKTAPKTSNSFFKYFVNNKIYINNYGQCPDDDEHKISKFFKLYYSSKDPNKIKVDFSVETKDTIEILKAGFSKEDLK